jgi:hypothetical protein
MGVAAQPLELFEGGPLWRLLVKTRLVQPPRKLLLRRIAALFAITWVPVALLCTLDGTAVGGGVTLPLLNDLVVHVRFLLAVPLLVLGEVLLGGALRGVLTYLGMSGIVPPQEEPGLVTLLEQARRRRDSLFVELLLLVFAFGTAALNFGATRELFMGASSWRMHDTSEGIALTRAGLWHAAVSLPLFQFLVLRWLWRLVIWALVLRSIARLELSLIASHPDRSGGVGFVGIGQVGFAAFLFAINAVLSAQIAEGVMYAQQNLADQRAVIAGAVVISMLLVLAPLIVFVGPLGRVKQVGRLRHGAMAAHHGRLFEQRWLGSDDPPDESILEAPDISSLADVEPGFARVERMRPLPIGRSELVPLALASALPYAPLALMVMPLSEILKRLLGALT